MAEFRYITGTASVAANGTVVSFSSARMLTYAMQGDDLSLNRLPAVKVLDVIDDTHLAIEPWAGAALTSVPYVLYQESILRATRGQVAADVSRLNASLKASGYFYSVPDDAVAPDPSDGYELQWASQESTGKRWRKVDGDWVYKGVYAVIQVLGEWDAAVSYALGQVVSRQGKLWKSRGVDNLNHAPESSPTQWDLFLSGGDAYDIANFDTDRPASGENVLDFPVTKHLKFYAGMTDSRARARVGATSTAIYTFLKNDVVFATMTFAAGGMNGAQQGVFSCLADTTFSPETFDYLTVIAPTVRDATLSTISWVIAAYRMP